MDFLTLLAALLAALFVGAAVQYLWPRPATVHEYERVAAEGDG